MLQKRWRWALLGMFLVGNGCCVYDCTRCCPPPPPQPYPYCCPAPAGGCPGGCPSPPRYTYVVAPEAPMPTTAPPPPPPDCCR